MRIRNKLFVLTGLFCAAMGAMLVNSSRQIERTRVGGPLFAEVAATKDLVADVLPPPLFIVESYLTAHQVADLTDASKIGQLSDRFDELEREFAERREYWAEHLKDGGLKEALLGSAAEKAQAFFRLVRTDLLPAVRAGKNDQARTILDERLDVVFNEQRAAVAAVVKLANAQAAAVERATAEELRTAFTALYAVTGALMAGLFAAGWLISRSITSPLRGVVAALRGIAEGEGDLTRRLSSDRTDELGELCSWFNTFVERMQGTLSRVASATDAVTTAAQRIAAASEESACSLRSQSEQNAMISGSVEQMSAATGDIAAKSVEAASIASKAGQSARGGGQGVAQTIEGIRSVSSLIREASGVVQQLGDRSQTIGQIIEVINDIADQTNLLALNAAIEAARAGEHGRGFAVVADEVRKLADRTTKATGEVTRSIRAIQQDTASAVQQIGLTTTRVEEGVALAEQTGKALEAIVSDTGEVSMMIQSIAAATEEQTSASVSVRSNVALIESSSGEAASAAAETAKSAATLYEQSRTLQSLVGGFKIS